MQILNQPQPETPLRITPYNRVSPAAKMLLRVLDKNYYDLSKEEFIEKLLEQRDGTSWIELIANGDSAQLLLGLEESLPPQIFDAVWDEYSEEYGL